MLRQAQDDLFGYQNSRKARLGGLAGLQDPAIMDAKRKAERRAARRRGQKDPKPAHDSGATPGTRSSAGSEPRCWARSTTDYELYERGVAFNTELFHFARMLVRLADESAKPNADRLREYAEAGLDSLKLQLFSEAPIYPDLETVKLTDSLGYLLERAGAENAFVKQIMAGYVAAPTRGRVGRWARNWPTSPFPEITG